MNAARATVWAHLTDPDLRSQWWESIELESGLGGAVRSTGEAGELAGTIDVWVAGHALGFTWQVPGAEHGTAVLMTLRSQGYQTGITVTETGFDSLADGAARAELAGIGWARFVEALAAANFDEVGVADATEVPGASGDAAVPESSEGSEPSESSEASELERAPLEIEGELEASATAEPIEVDAEPGLGDHLELVTGPIDLPNEALPDDNGSAGSENLVGEGVVDELVPLVLPEPPSTVGEETPADTEDDLADKEDEPEPDFDSLLRGLL